ncbi:MAG: hypothetical protein V2A76_11975 [Planctomycetota bacterium]
MVTRRGVSQREDERENGHPGQETSGGVPDRLRGARIGSLTATDRDSVAAYLVGLRRSSRILVDPRLFDTSAERSGDDLVLETAVGASTPCSFRAAVVRSGIQLRLEDSVEGRVLFFRRLLSSFGAKWEALAIKERTREGAPGEQYMLSGFLEDARKAHRLEMLGRIGAALPFLVSHGSASKELSYLLPPQGAERVLVWCAREGVGTTAFAARGGWRLLEEALAPLLHAHGRALTAVLGMEGTIAFVKKIVLVAHDAERSGEPDRLVGRKLRNALRSAFYADGCGAPEALAELAETLGEEAAELAALSRPAGCAGGDRADSRRRRLETLGGRGDLVARRLVRAARSDRSSAGLEVAARQLGSASGLMLEIARSSSLPLRGAGADAARGPFESALQRQLDRSVCAAQSFLRAALSSRDRVDSSHEEIGSQLWTLKEVARLARDEEHAAVAAPREDAAQPLSSERELLWLLGRLGEVCRHLSAACEELFEHSLECSAREVEELN